MHIQVKARQIFIDALHFVPSKLVFQRIIFGLTFIVLLVFLSGTFIIQALLRKRETTVVHEVTHSFLALIRAPWTLVYFLAMFLNSIQYSEPVRGPFQVPL